MVKPKAVAKSIKKGGCCMNSLPVRHEKRIRQYRVESMPKEKIFLSSPHLDGNEMKYVSEAFTSNWIAPHGPNVEEFEKELSAIIGVKSSAALSSGTAAIHLALRLLNVERGDLVFCSSLTFVASANPILYLGGEPVFIDSEEETWNMSPVALKGAFDAAIVKGQLPKAVVVVNLFGQSAKMDELTAICEEYNVPIIEDAAESLGSLYKGRHSGTIGKFGIYSFNGNKIITTSSGGMLVSNDEDLIKETKFLASQAKDPAPYYKHSVVGYNYRMSNVLAGIGRGQLESLQDRVSARRRVYHRYAKEFKDIKAISFQPELSGTYSNRWLSAMLLDPKQTLLTPEKVKRVLDAEQIEARHVWNPLHTQQLFKDCEFFSHDEEEAVSEKLFKQGLCLPSGSNMTDVQQGRVIDAIKALFN